MKNKRGFYRLESKRPFCANMEIIWIRNNAIQTGNAQVCIDDIAAGGLRFVSRSAAALGKIPPQMTAGF